MRSAGLFLAPQASQFGFRGHGIHGGGSATLFGHGLDASSPGFGNQATSLTLAPLDHIAQNCSIGRGRQRDASAATAEPGEQPNRDVNHD